MRIADLAIEMQSKVALPLDLGLGEGQNGRNFRLTAYHNTDRGAFGVLSGPIEIGAITGLACQGERLSSKRKRRSEALGSRQ